MKNKLEIKQNGIVIYPSVYESVIQLRENAPELANKLINAILDYGFTGEYDDSDFMVNALIANIIPNIDSALERYEKAVENGKKGGRPSEIDKEEVFRLKESGLSNREIAEELGSNPNTIKSILQRNKGAKGANLDIDNYIDIEKDTNTNIEKDTNKESSDSNSANADSFKEKNSKLSAEIEISNFLKDKYYEDKAEFRKNCEELNLTSLIKDLSLEDKKRLKDYIEKPYIVPQTESNMNDMDGIIYSTIDELYSENLSVKEIARKVKKSEDYVKSIIDNIPDERRKKIENSCVNTQEESKEEILSTYKGKIKKIERANTYDNSIAYFITFADGEELPYPIGLGGFDYEIERHYNPNFKEETEEFDCELPFA